MGHSVSHTHARTLGGQGSPGEALVTVHPSVLLLSHVKTEHGWKTQDGKNNWIRKPKKIVKKKKKKDIKIEMMNL